MITEIPPVPEYPETPFNLKEWFKLIRNFINNKKFSGNTTYGSLIMPPLAGRPSDRTVGQVAIIYTTGGSTDARTATPRPMYTDGTDWKLFSDDTTWTG